MLPLHKSSTANPKPILKIEDYQAGYPRYTALISAHKPYFLCRQFNKIRARLLLLKQDRLYALEQRLEQVDQQETSPLFLGKSRCDRNPDRIALLSEIEHHLADYDLFVERTCRSLNLANAHHRDVESLQNWLSGTGCLAREETAYLSDRELVCLAPVSDSAIGKLEAWVETGLIRLHRGFRKSPFHDVSDDPNVYIYSGPWIRRSAKALLLLLIILFLLIPVVICNMVNANSVRLTIIMASTVSYLVVISALVHFRTMDLILAGATYATVLTVFVSVLLREKKYDVEIQMVALVLGGIFGQSDTICNTKIRSLRSYRDVSEGQDINKASGKMSISNLYVVCNATWGSGSELDGGDMPSPEVHMVHSHMTDLLLVLRAQWK